MRARTFSSLRVIASSINLISCFTVSPSLGFMGAGAAQTRNTLYARSTVSCSTPMAITRTCRPFSRYAEKNFVALPLEMIEDESGTPAGMQEMNK